MSQNPDNVNKPSHYTHGSIEVIDFVRSGQFPDEWVTGYLVITAWIYMTRCAWKNGIEDVRKAQRYIDWTVEWMERTQNANDCTQK